ncbi:hypothetical protein DIPPA_03208 [Diplonema papillatum]|nr:hypothetical protein DIPPA_03208 [Diplonema papillatum]
MFDGSDKPFASVLASPLRLPNVASIRGPNALAPFEFKCSSPHFSTTAVPGCREDSPLSTSSPPATRPWGAPAAFSFLQDPFKPRPSESNTSTNASPHAGGILPGWYQSETAALLEPTLSEVRTVWGHSERAIRSMTYAKPGVYHAALSLFEKLPYVATDLPPSIEPGSVWFCSRNGAEASQLYSDGIRWSRSGSRVKIARERLTVTFMNEKKANALLVEHCVSADGALQRRTYRLAGDGTPSACLCIVHYLSKNLVSKSLLAPFLSASKFDASIAANKEGLPGTSKPIPTPQVPFSFATVVSSGKTPCISSSFDHLSTGGTPDGQPATSTLTTVSELVHNSFCCTNSTKSGQVSHPDAIMRSDSPELMTGCFTNVDEDTDEFLLASDPGDGLRDEPFLPSVTIVPAEVAPGDQFIVLLPEALRPVFSLTLKVTIAGAPTTFTALPHNCALLCLVPDLPVEVPGSPFLELRYCSGLIAAPCRMVFKGYRTRDYRQGLLSCLQGLGDALRARHPEQEDTGSRKEEQAAFPLPLHTAGERLPVEDPATAAPLPHLCKVQTNKCSPCPITGTSDLFFDSNSPASAAKSTPTGPLTRSAPHRAMKDQCMAEDSNAPFFTSDAPSFQQKETASFERSRRSCDADAVQLKRLFFSVIHAVVDHAVVDPNEPSTEGDLLFAPDCEGITLLHYCAYLGLTGPLDLLLTYAPAAAVDAKDARGLTPLHYAVMKDNNDATVAILLEAGAARNAQDSNGNTPFSTAVDLSNSSVRLFRDNAAKELSLSPNSVAGTSADTTVEDELLSQLSFLTHDDDGDLTESSEEWHALEALNQMTVAGTEPDPHHTALIIQRNVRKWSAQRQYHLVRRSIETLQAAVRGRMARKEIDKLKKVLTIQRSVRQWLRKRGLSPTRNEASTSGAKKTKRQAHQSSLSRHHLGSPATCGKMPSPLHPDSALNPGCSKRSLSSSDNKSTTGIASELKAQMQAVATIQRSVREWLQKGSSDSFLDPCLLPAAKKRDAFYFEPPSAIRVEDGLLGKNSTPESDLSARLEEKEREVTQLTARLEQEELREEFRLKLDESLDQVMLLQRHIRKWLQSRNHDREIEQVETLSSQLDKILVIQRATRAWLRSKPSGR